MKNNFYSIKPFKKIFAKPNTKSEIISDLLYGEKFKILLKKGKWIKIKTIFDNYTGYIKNKKFKFVRIPKFEEVPFPVMMEPNLVIEYYSR